MTVESDHRPAAHRRSAVILLFRDPRVVVGVLAVLGVVLLAIGSPWIGPHDPEMLGVGPNLSGPSAAFPFGTDQFGRDQLSRVIAGTRVSVTVASSVVLLALTIGLPFGLIAGYLGGLVDYWVSRVVDIMFSFPSLLVVLTVVTLLGPGIPTIIIGLTIAYVPVVIRFVRAAVAAERGKEYIVSARVSGASITRIIWHHIVPNIASSLIILSTTMMSFTILAEASLSYLGFGAPPSTASWGRMVTENSGFLTSKPYLLLFPGGAIVALVLALNLMGDGLRDVLDPRLRGTDLAAR